MKRYVIATPLFEHHLKTFLESYTELGATRFIERLKDAYLAMVENITNFEEIGVARRRTVNGKSIAVREYVLDVDPRDFLVLYRVPPAPDQPIILLNIRIGGQNKFRWV
jgi:hypothetical protein